jgi:heptosyltransferase III
MRIELPVKPSILVVALRRLGDVLLTTPLIRSLRRAWPNARIEALVFADTAPILDGNPDLDGVVVMSPRPTASEGFALAAKLWKHYDLAVSTQSGDRPTLFAWIAGRAHVGLVDSGLRGAARKVFLNRSVPQSERIHRVEEVLRLADALGVGRAFEVVCPTADLAERLPQQPYAVIHVAPMFGYKQWTREGWRAVAAALAERGLAIVATGGPSAVERTYLDEVWQGASFGVQRCDGRLSWAEIGAYLSGAEIYVGPDTSVTHLAAASGCPTIALYGPTDPRLWGPWPAGGLTEAWAAAGTVQRRGNVWLVQNPLPCLPCQNEGCDRHLRSRSRCLDELTPDQVLLAVDQALAGKRRLKTGAPEQRPVRMG